MDPKERCASKIDCVYAKYIGKPVFNTNQPKSIKDVLTDAKVNFSLKKVIDGILGAE